MMLVALLCMSRLPFFPLFLSHRVLLHCCEATFLIFHVDVPVAVRSPSVHPSLFTLMASIFYSPEFIQLHANQMVSRAVEDVVQQEKPQINEIPEQKRILKECAKAFHSSFHVIISPHDYSTFMAASHHPIPIQTDEKIDKSALNLPLINNSTILKSHDSEILAVFWKNAFNVPFGSTVGHRIIHDLSEAIYNLESVYTPPPPPATDKRHRNAKPQPGICGLWHFAWWFAQGQNKTREPVISAHLIEAAYK